MLLDADGEPEQQKHRRAGQEVAINIVEIEFFDQAITRLLQDRSKTIGKAGTLPHLECVVTHFLE